MQTLIQGFLIDRLLQIVETIPRCHSAFEHRLTLQANVLYHHQASSDFAACESLNFAIAAEKSTLGMDHTA